MAYINDEHIYTSPLGYDARKKKLLEKYNKKAWDPIIKKTGKEYIKQHDIVCDFGCGTLAHFSAMEQAGHVYALDSNQQMLAFGLEKLTAEQRRKITPVICDAVSTPLSANTCSIIWSIGLTEYTDLEKLFSEMTRVASFNAVMLLQFPNANNILHMVTRIINIFRNKPTKKFRSLAKITSTAQKFGWQIELKQTAFIGNNWWCVLRKSSPV